MAEAEQTPRERSAMMEAEVSAELRRLQKTPEAVASLRRMMRRRIAEFDASWSDRRVFAELRRRLHRGELGLWLQTRSREPNSKAMGSANIVAPSEPPPERKVVELHWIEIELVGEDDKPIPGAAYRIELPDGSVRQGRLDEGGLARVDGIENPGSCKISFPKLDKEAWEPLE